MKSTEESLRKPLLPAQLALKYHPFHRGRLGSFQNAPSDPSTTLRSGRRLTWHIISTMDDWEVFPRKAIAVAEKVIERGAARISRTGDELLASVRSIIRRAREQAKYLMRSGFIREFPTYVRNYG